MLVNNDALNVLTLFDMGFVEPSVIGGRGGVRAHPS